MKKSILLLALLGFSSPYAQTDARIYTIIDAVSAERIQADVTKLANFGTRHTLSDTISNIGALGRPGGGSRVNSIKFRWNAKAASTYFTKRIWSKKGTMTELWRMCMW